MKRGKDLNGLVECKVEMTVITTQFHADMLFEKTTDLGEREGLVIFPETSMTTRPIKVVDR